MCVKRSKLSPRHQDCILHNVWKKIGNLTGASKYLKSHLIRQLWPMRIRGYSLVTVPQSRSYTVDWWIKINGCEILENVRHKIAVREEKESYLRHIYLIETKRSIVTKHFDTKIVPNSKLITWKLHQKKSLLMWYTGRLKVNDKEIKHSGVVKKNWGLTEKNVGRVINTKMYREMNVNVQKPNT